MGLTQRSLYDFPSKTSVIINHKLQNTMLYYANCLSALPYMAITYHVMVFTDLLFNFQTPTGRKRSYRSLARSCYTKIESWRSVTRLFKTNAGDLYTDGATPGCHFSGWLVEEDLSISILLEILFHYYGYLYTVHQIIVIIIMKNLYAQVYLHYKPKPKQLLSPIMCNGLQKRSGLL